MFNVVVIIHVKCKTELFYNIIYQIYLEKKELE